MSVNLSRCRIVAVAPFARTEYRISMSCDTLLLLVVFPLITFPAVSPAPVTDFRLGESKAIRDLGTKSFFGPWSVALKTNGDYVDYADYGGEVPATFHGTWTDEPIGIAGHTDPQDFLDRHDMGLRKLLRDYGPSPLGLAVFRVGVHPDYWLSKNEKLLAGHGGNDLLEKPAGNSQN